MKGQFFSGRKKQRVENVKLWNEVSADEKKQRVINGLTDLKQLCSHDKKLCSMIDGALNEIKPLEGERLKKYLDEVGKRFGFN